MPACLEDAWEHHCFDLVGLVLQAQKKHRVAVFGKYALRFRNDCVEQHAIRFFCFNVADGVLPFFRRSSLKLVERMSGYVEAQEFFFPFEFFLHGCWRGIQKPKRGNRRFVRHEGKKRRLVLHFCAAEITRVLEYQINVFKYLVSLGERVEGSAFGERFDRFFIERARIGAFQKVLERGERPVFFALLDERVGNSLAKVFDGEKPETDFFVGVFYHRKVLERSVDVRRQNGDVHSSAFGDHDRYRFDVSGLRGEHCAHVFGGEMRFHVRGLIRHPSICGRMRLTETVSLERFEQVPNFFRLSLGHRTMCLAARNKNIMLLCHFCRNFFPHRLSKFINGFPVVPRKFHGGEKQIILIYQNAV